MKHTGSKAALSPARRRLVELMQEVNYGRIKGLQIRDGEPVFDPSPTVLRTFVLDKANGPNEARGLDNFTLKRRVTRLFEIFDRKRSLLVEELIIENGLPGRMTVATGVRA